MTMETTENSLYALLIGISKDVGEIKSDVKNVQANVETYNEESTKADEKVSNKLEEYFQYAKNRQDSIKAELETKIGNVRSDVTDLADRVHNIEQGPKNSLWSIFLQFKSVLIAAIISLAVGWSLSFVGNIIKQLKQPEKILIEKPLPPVDLMGEHR